MAEWGALGTWIGVAIGIIGLVFALYERHERAKIETAIREHLRRLAGNISVMYSNANWSDIHYRHIGSGLSEDIPNLVIIKKEAFDGARDAASCKRQLWILHSHLQGIQKSLFNDSEEILPKIMADDVQDAQRRLDESKTKNAATGT